MTVERTKILATFLVSLALVLSVAGIGYLKWESQERAEYQSYIEQKKIELEKFWDCCDSTELPDPYKATWTWGRGYVCPGCIYLGRLTYEEWKASRPSFWEARN